MQTVYPTLVCICSGWTWVDGCEGDAGKANRMNAVGPAAIAAAARKASAGPAPSSRAPRAMTSCARGVRATADCEC